MAERRADLMALIGVNWNAGHHFLFTPTARHHLGVKWANLRDAIKIVARKQQQATYWRNNVLGFTRADENTWRCNGHHFHQHYLLTLRPEVDTTTFKEWLQAFWERWLRKLERSCDWVGRWWEPIRSIEEIERVFNYQTKAWEEEFIEGDPVEALRGALQEVTGTATKKQTPWDWPPHVFAEVWRSSKGHRWFGSSGIWKINNAPELTEDEIEARRESKGEGIAWIHAPDFLALAKEVKRELLEGVYSRRMDLDAFTTWWIDRSIALGGVLGLGPAPLEFPP